MSDELVLEEAAGSISVPPATLERLVAQAAERVDGVRVRRPRRGVAVELGNGAARVSVQLAVRHGLALPELAERVQAEVRDALAAMCGVEVRAVDVSVEELLER
jgi:uncharacterized alkaline shock family protein YloU